MKSQEEIIERLVNTMTRLNKFKELQSSDPVIERIIQKLNGEYDVLKWMVIGEEYRHK